MAAVASSLFHAQLPPSFMLRSGHTAATTTSRFGGGGRRPAPLNLTYSISKVPSRDGSPLVLPAILTRSSSAYGAAAIDRAAASSPAWKPIPNSPRTFAGHLQTSSPARFNPGSIRGGPPSRERVPTSASFLTRRFSMPSQAEQDNFRQLCQARFYEQDRDATLQVEALLKDASATAQSCYNKILSSVRQKYHEDVSRERQDNLRRVLLEAAPDFGISKDERRARVRNYLESYASKEVIGTHPFLKGLYSVLYLQTLRESKGGAGGKCIEWALQEEVFTEAGTGQWMNESVALLKTILAMTDVTQQEQDETSPFHTQKSLPIGSNNRSMAHREDIPGLKGETLSEGTIRRLRMSPALGNPELLDLLAIFPTWISQGRARDHRFPLPSQNEALQSQPSIADMEEGTVGADQEKTDPNQMLRISHGTVRISPEDREPGFEGTLVERVTGWLKRLFGTV